MIVRVYVLRFQSYIRLRCVPRSPAVPDGYLLRDPFRDSRLRTGHPNAMFPAEGTVALTSVNLIRQNPTGIMAEPLEVFLDDPLELGCFSFVVCIEG